MSSYKFSAAERYAVFTVHREKCWLCGEPVSLVGMEVDHVVPESLEGTPKLEEVVAELGLPGGFDLNSYENWMPAHRQCNGVKTGTVFKATPLIQLHIQKAEERAGKAREIEARFASDRSIDRAIHQLLAASERGTLTEEQKRALAPVIETVTTFHEGNRAAEDRGRPLMLAPWLEIVGEHGDVLTLRGPEGMIGRRPKGPRLHSSWDCPTCGPTGWDGARCIVCGQMNDD